MLQAPTQDSFVPSTLEQPVAARPVARETPTGGARVAPAIDAMFRRMVEVGASDLHLSSAMPPMVRKDGEMRLLHEGAPPLSAELVARLLWEIAPPQNKAEFEQRHDTDFAYEIAGLARFRANLFLDRHGIGAVFRVIPSKILTGGAARALAAHPQPVSI